MKDDRIYVHPILECIKNVEAYLVRTILTPLQPKGVLS